MVQADCSLTHWDRICSEAAISYVMAIRDLILGKNETVCPHKHKKSEILLFP